MTTIISCTCSYKQMQFNRAKSIIIYLKFIPCLQMGTDQRKTVDLESFQQLQQTNVSLFVSESQKVTPGILCPALGRIRDELNVIKGRRNMACKKAQGFIYWTNKKIKNWCAMRPLTAYMRNGHLMCLMCSRKAGCQCLEARSDQGNFENEKQN